MDDPDALRGSCICGRNHYKIQLPEDVTNHHAQIYFDSSRDNRRFHGAPITAWLRVPLDWYQSHTQSFFPDETHSLIRRIFSPQHAPHTKRVFCGFCGTPLSLWSEDPPEEAEFMSVTVGSLNGDDQRLLEDLDLVPGSSEDEEEEEEESNDEEEEETPAGDPMEVSRGPHSPSNVVSTTTPGISRTVRHGTLGGIPWFEEMIEGSRLGRVMKGRRGAGTSDDNSTSIEWEVSEWSNDPGVQAVQAVGKRKRGPYTSGSEGSPSKRA